MACFSIRHLCPACPSPRFTGKEYVKDEHLAGRTIGGTRVRSPGLTDDVAVGCGGDQ